jgi:hypothetical protein
MINITRFRVGDRHSGQDVCSVCGATFYYDDNVVMIAWKLDSWDELSGVLLLCEACTKTWDKRWQDMQRNAAKSV